MTPQPMQTPTKIPVLVTPGKTTPKAPKVVINSLESFGKTSMAAFAPEPAILMAKGEDGYETLHSVGRVPAVPRVTLTTWDETLAALQNIRNNPTMKTLALDALGGFELQAQEYICQTEFRGDWGERGFGGFRRGYDLTSTEWVKLLSLLGDINDKGVTIILLSHSTVKSFKNPIGEDFDRYTVDCHHKVWSVTHKWADAVFFGKFLEIVDTDKSQRKRGIGGTERVIYTERRDAYDAKNRYGLPPEIAIPNDPALAWKAIWKSKTNSQGEN